VVIAAIAAVSAATAAASADPSPAVHRAVATPHVVPTPTPALPSPTTAAPTVTRLTPKPTHAAKAEPVSHGVISGLAANGIPSVALNAYRVAAARMANVAPGCGVPWYLLAGIGREESDHGRFGGAQLHADGLSTPPIIGPALDGVHWDYIPAPADGVTLDGDAVYAHALGPMQFIPSTWALFGADADGDGSADVFDIFDAALGAARYLCAAGGDLRTTAGKTRAVLAYNHNDQYVAQVLALADAYRQGIPVSGIPVGITTGSLPPVKHRGALPPANPAAPTATGGSAGSGGHPGSASGPSAAPSGSGAKGSTGSAHTSASASASGAPGSSAPSGSSGSASPSGSSPAGGSGSSPHGSGAPSTTANSTAPSSPTPSGGSSSPTCHIDIIIIGCLG